MRTVNGIGTVLVFVLFVTLRRGVARCGVARRDLAQKKKRGLYLFGYSFKGILKLEFFIWGKSDFIGDFCAIANNRCFEEIFGF